MSTRKRIGSEQVGWLQVGKHLVEIIGYYLQDTPDDEFANYDLYLDGECLTADQPLPDRPTEEDAKKLIDARK